MCAGSPKFRFRESQHEAQAFRFNSTPVRAHRSERRIGTHKSKCADGSRLAVLWWRARPVSVRDPLGDHVVPLLLGLAVEKCDDAHGHVVAADAAGLAVRCEAVVHHVLADGGQVLLRGNASSDKLNDSLRGLAIPDTWILLVVSRICLESVEPTVTSDDQELVVLAHLVNGHVGESSDDLLLRREVCALLELKIADSSAKGKVAVNSAKVDESTGCADAGLLALVLGLVVEGERLRAALDAED